MKGWIVGSGLLVVITIALGMWGLPQYGVWEQHMHGKAELARAEYAKQVAVQEALARKNASLLNGQADSTRANYQAIANTILKQSLSGAEGQAYLRYLWIHTISEHANAPTVIYVPTEAGMPILEAGHRP